MSKIAAASNMVLICFEEISDYPEENAFAKEVAVAPYFELLDYCAPF